MNEWSPPAGATPEQYRGGKDPDGSVQLADAIADALRIVRDLPHHLLEQAGIRVEPDLVRFTGAVRVEGTLDLPAGIIGNDALTSPVEVEDFDHTETGFDPVAGAWATVSSVTLTVPAGFSQAVVQAIAYAGITGAGGDIHCRATVAGVGGPADTRSTSPSQWRPVLSMFSHRVTGLTGGGTVAVACQAYVATDVAADAANTATISGTVQWLR